MVQSTLGLFCQHSLACKQENKVQKFTHELEANKLQAKRCHYLNQRGFYFEARGVRAVMSLEKNKLKKDQCALSPLHERKQKADG